MSINTKNITLDTIAQFTSIEEALDYFEIGYDSQFIAHNREELTKRFSGNLILEKPEDWFSGRSALKKAYCKIQRAQLSKLTRQACRGCTSCQRR